MGSDGNKTWTFQEYSRNGNGRGVCVIRSGERVIGLVKGRSHADQICRARSEAKRIAYDSQRHLIRLRMLNEENRLLVSALRRVADALRGSSEGELSLARQEVSKALKRIRGRHGAG